MLDPGATLNLAERVSAAARQLGIATALIGGAALAVHRYPRGTEDMDLATYVDPFSELERLQRALASEGLLTRARHPDADDPPGGTLSVWEREDDDGEPVDVVEVVNFLNPLGLRRSPARNAILRAIDLPGGGLRCVTLADLIALKLYAGGAQDLSDIIQLLAHNADADLDTVRSAATPYDTDGHLEGLIAAAAMLRASR